MRSEKRKESDERFSSLLSIVDRGRREPDRNFLDQLKQRSTEEFMSCASRDGTTKLRQSDNPVSMWRTMMNSRTAKLATAAAIAIISGLLITIWSNSTKPVWAIDQTIEALKDIEGIYLSGIFYNDGVGAKVEMWGRPRTGDDTNSGDFRLHEGDNHIAVASEKENRTYVYFPLEKEVHVLDGIKKGCRPWLGSSFFQNMKQNAKNWEQESGRYGKTGQKCVSVTFSHRSSPGPQYWLVQFDVETKLPIGVKLWWDAERRDLAYDIRKIEYNPKMPEGIFTFEIPEGTEVKRITDNG